MKISAPVCFISLSAPSITMYAMTTMAQPSPEREAILEASPELTTRWDEIHRSSFIPAMHFMMFLSILGFASSLHSLAKRWDEFKLKPFSPAHAAFVFPVLSHTNAIQSYRRVVIGFALQPSPYHTVITAYWILCLVGGTFLNFIFTTKYANRLPKWTNFDQKLAEDVEGDDESLQVSPPDPDDGISSHMSSVAAICCLLFFGKLMLAWKLVADELSNPTTATPMGVVCITVICVLAGRFGSFGKYGVVSVSVFHVLLSFWFLYIAVFRFRLWPDPSWFPCTVGIAYASIKSWLYYPLFGWTLLILCVTYLFGTFLLAIYRAYTNMKISAPVCFISLSAPSITMYAMTTMAQPSPEREAILEASPELTTRWDEIHRNSFIPAMHFMMFLSMLGFASSLHSLARRWDEFKLKPFSPAHAAFVFPVLSHTNAIQSYRRVVIGFALQPSLYHTVITAYWILCLVGGTLLNFIFTTKYANRLPKWTNFDQKLAEDVEGDDESLQVSPPDPDDTIVHELWADTTAHEALREKFSNPAVLQANEAGILVRRRRGTEDYYQKGPYARSRNVPSIGFDPTLSLEELRKERAELLDWVVKNNPRQRHKTMSIPAIGGYGTFGLLG
eukprot:CAMPEP_0113521452 /NCGR_PEP_ID=MMETSP0014_2-20120614/44648_1 /TAXON_ID=2857 /ORGANISM="Nitzschia sp." /LENGTH=615 /DNA_ID=CAMNT_0000419413 /DNA_START=470 /DNA_END=2315 /DNA_ORIENTATION=+ /assembly_acc=CAM_ASM_000159